MAIGYDWRFGVLREHFVRTHYDSLHIQESASPEVIRAAYKALAQKWHPDKNSHQRELAEKAFKSINAAHEILANPAERIAYDAWLAGQRESRFNADAQAVPPSQAAAASTVFSDPLFPKLWGGKVAPWKVFWLYIVAVPLLASIVASSSLQAGTWTFVMFMIFAFAYFIFMHICLWRSGGVETGRTSKMISRGYCILLVSSPAWIFAISSGMKAYDDWSAKRQAIQAGVSPSWMGDPVVQTPVPSPTQPVMPRQTPVAAAPHVTSPAPQPDGKPKTAEEIEFEYALDLVYRKYPFLNIADARANRAAIDEAVDRMKSFMAEGYSRAQAVKKASDGVAAKYVR